MRLPYPKMVFPAAFMGCALLFVGASCPALSQPDRTGAQAASDTTVQTPAPPTATLQVSGTATEFTIGADHADVQSALKLVFDQAGKQFSLGNDVIAQVTLRLERQPFDTVLDALCRQAFLRYQISPAGIYQFSRNTEALHTFILQQNTLNEALLQRMRGFGLNAFLNLLPAGPPDTQRPGISQRLSGGGGGFGGGFSPNAIPGMAGGSMADSTASAFPAAKSAVKPSTLDRSVSLEQNQVFRYQPSSTVPEAQIIVQPGLVSVRTAPDHPVALTDLLAELSRQTHIPILIDPQVPSGIKFRFAGNLTAHSLPEWLGQLAPVARLQWYSVGNQIFVTTSPEFAIFYGSSDVPRATFGMTPAQASPNQPRGAAAARQGASQKSAPNK